MKLSTNSLMIITASLLFATAVLNGCGGVEEESCLTCEQGKAEISPICPDSDAKGYVRGTLLDPEGEVLSGTEVHLQGERCEVIGSTDEVGSYLLSIGTTGPVILGLYYQQVWVAAKVKVQKQPKVEDQEQPKVEDQEQTREYNFQIMRNPKNRFDFHFRLL